MNLVFFPEDYYDDGAVRFAKGSYQPLNSLTASLVEQGFAQEVDSDDAENAADVLAALAAMADARALDLESQAQAARKEADAAREMADAALAKQLDAAKTKAKTKVKADQAA